MVIIKSIFFLSLFTINDIPDGVKELFSYHYDRNQFDQEIAKRSLDLFVESFDLDHSYFLWSEVKPMLSPSGKWIDFTRKSYSNGSFDSFIEIQKIFEQAIERRITFENEVIRDLLDKPYKEVKKIAELRFDPYPANFAQLKTKIKSEAAFFALKESLMGKYEYEKVKKKLYSYFQKKQREKELEYRQRGLSMEEHYFSIHVLKAIAASMDAHTRFFSPDEKREMRQALSKDFSGIGVVLRDSMDGLVIQRVVDNSPASHAGIQAKDVITKIDGQDISNLYFREAIELLSGRNYTRVRLEIQREGQKFEVSLNRAPILSPESQAQVTLFPFGTGAIAAIRLDGFFDNDQGNSAAQQLESAIVSIQKEQELKAVILDLRKNTGGFLTQAARVCSIFTGGGPIVLARYGNGQISVVKEKLTKPLFDGPLIILISRLSASASEIVAQTLKEYGVAIIVGDSNSYGKGSMQYQTITSDEPYCYAVTIAKYYTISGASVQLKGVASDIHVPTELSQIPIGEQYLKYPLGYDTLAQNFKHLSLSSKDELGQIFSFYQKQASSSVLRVWIPQLRALSEKRGLRADVADPALFEAQEIARDLVMYLNGGKEKKSL
ncbi:MAG: S41 family peptidase [Chlamydiae bacterium]|nr:S41 family peptidase [Chlamydiota bacterium]